MSSSEHPAHRPTRRRALALVAAGAGGAALSGCLRPMLAETAPAAEIAGKVALPPIDSRLGRIFTKTLEARLGKPGADPPYRLEVERQQEERGLLVAQDNAVTRIQIRQTARFRLYARGQAEPLMDESLSSEAGFDETASLYSSRVTRRRVEERLARDLAERIARRIQARAPQLLAG